MPCLSTKPLKQVNQGQVGVFQPRESTEKDSTELTSEMASPIQPGQLCYVEYNGFPGVIHTRLCLAHVVGDDWAVDVAST